MILAKCVRERVFLMRRKSFRLAELVSEDELVGVIFIIFEILCGFVMLSDESAFPIELVAILAIYHGRNSTNLELGYSGWTSDVASHRLCVELFHEVEGLEKGCLDLRLLCIPIDILID